MRTGMITLEQAGIIKAVQGETSLDEVYRVARKMEDLDEESKTPANAPAPKPEIKIKQTKQVPSKAAQPKAQVQPQAKPAAEPDIQIKPPPKAPQNEES